MTTTTNPEFWPLDEEDRLMTWKEFSAFVEEGVFIDYDGYGALATATTVSNITVTPSQVHEGSPHFVRPEWATHVCWYSR